MIEEEDIYAAMENKVCVSWFLAVVAEELALIDRHCM